VVREWAGVEVGAAAYLEPIPATSPPLVRASLAVDHGGRAATREHRLGGDVGSIRIRAGTLLLDLLRHALPPPGEPAAGR
jgi:hypothetical protein